MTIFPAIVIAARFRSMSVRMAFHRGIFYAMIIALIAIVFFSSEFVIEKWIWNNDEVVDIAAAILGTFAFTRLRGFFEIMTDHIFFKGRYDYGKAVVRVSETLGSNIDLKKLVNALGLFLTDTIKPDRIMFFLKDEKAVSGFEPVFDSAPLKATMRGYAVFVSDVAAYFSSREARPVVFETTTSRRVGRSRDGPTHLLAEAGRGLGITSIVPIVYRGRINALLLIGKKRSGDPLSVHDGELLMLISRQAGMAIENARLYEAVRRHAHGLEQQVASRTERIKNMYEAQSKFLVEMSHEFQTPIAILKMNLEACGGSGRSGKQAYYVMETTLDRLSRLTQGLLQVARLNFSKERFAKEPIDLQSLINDARDDCLLLAEDKGVALAASSEKVVILGDQDKLKEVLLNLLSNAFKHTAAGGSVDILGRSIDGEVEIAVRDTGSGIPGEYLPHIFERFYRTRTSAGRGTGLGLHLCRRIIEAHGGTITVDSKLHEGSRFVIHLPTFKERDVADPVEH